MSRLPWPGPIKITRLFCRFYKTKTSKWSFTYDFSQEGERGVKFLSNSNSFCNFRQGLLFFSDKGVGGVLFGNSFYVFLYLHSGLEFFLLLNFAALTHVSIKQFDFPILKIWNICAWATTLLLVYTHYTKVLRHSVRWKLPLRVPLDKCGKRNECGDVTFPRHTSWCATSY